MSVMLSEKFDSNALFAKLGKSVTVLAMLDGGERRASVATAVCNIADEPASILVCLKQASSFATPLLADNGKPLREFSINVLAAQQRELLDHLMQSNGDQRFLKGDWQSTNTGVPYLADAACILHCHLNAWHTVATHCICIAHVVAAGERARTGTIIYHDNDFHLIGDE